MNTFGENFRFTDFGESHGAAVGGVIDGCPSGLSLDMAAVQQALERRAGRTLPKEWQVAVSPRALAERNEVEWLSGVLDGVTLGSPIAFIIRNQEARPADYEVLKSDFRPAHADAVYEAKYGIRDYHGGGRSSARETAARVVAGCIAKQILEKKDITVHTQIAQIGNAVTEDAITALLHKVSEEGDSVGGIIECVIQGLAAGIGEPVFDKLQARLAYAVMSVNGCKGFDYGSGFEGVGKRGSEMYYSSSEELQAANGGILGGISDGNEIRFRCVFKPTATLTRVYGGRHDACIALRAGEVVEAMTAMTVVDMI